MFPGFELHLLASLLTTQKASRCCEVFGNVYTDWIIEYSWRRQFQGQIFDTLDSVFHVPWSLWDVQVFSTTFITQVNRRNWTYFSEYYGFQEISDYSGVVPSSLWLRLRRQTKIVADRASLKSLRNSGNFQMEGRMFSKFVGSCGWKTQAGRPTSRPSLKSGQHDRIRDL